MDMIPNIIGYHTNDKDRCEKFINNFECIFSEDTYWLGCGMYFWDTKSNAVYWKDEKFRKHKYINIIWIVSANIILDSVLDLTDREIVKDFEELWKNYCKLKEINTERQKEISLGIRLNILFKFYDLKYNVIKCHAVYKNINNSIFLKNDKITQQIKTIMCVRNSENIKNQKFIEEFKHE